MKLNNKRIPVKQRELLEKQALREFDKIALRYQEYMGEQLMLFVQLALHLTLEQKLGFGDKRRTDFLSYFVKTFNDIANELVENKTDFNVNGKLRKKIDVEANQDALFKMFDSYGIEYKPNCFDNFFESLEETNDRNA